MIFLSLAISVFFVVLGIVRHCAQRRRGIRLNAICSYEERTGNPCPNHRAIDADSAYISRRLRGEQKRGWMSRRRGNPR